MYDLKQCPSRNESVVCHPVMIGTKTDDISWYILTSLDSRLNAMLRNVKTEHTVRVLAAIWD